MDFHFHFSFENVGDMMYFDLLHFLCVCPDRIVVLTYFYPFLGFPM